MLKKVSGLFVGGALVVALAACADSDVADSDKEADKVIVSSEKDTEKVEVPSEEVKKEETETAPEKAESKSNTFYAEILKEEIPMLTEEQLELKQESYDYIKDNSNLLPAKTEENITLAKEKSEKIDLKLLNKNVAPYYSTLTSFEGYVVQIEEENYDNGETASWVNIGDDNGNNHIYYSYKGTGDILEEDYVRFYGLPIGKYSYETTDGGFQNAQVFFGSHIEKAQ